MVELKKLASMRIFKFSRSCCREFRSLRPRTCGTCMVVYQHIFRFRCLTTSMLHVLEGGLNVEDLSLGPHAPRTSIPKISSSGGHLKSLVYETLVATVEDLTALIVVPSADIASTSGLFELVRQSIVRWCRLC
ncbi:hypothetical protein TNCV_3548941 [Trichonephila clavipes]|nr:hypothetical protein TNCV_3548941 [Trichonephila clavipes]